MFSNNFKLIKVIKYLPRNKVRRNVVTGVCMITTVASRNHRLKMDTNLYDSTALLILSLHLSYTISRTIIIFFVIRNVPLREKWCFFFRYDCSKMYVCVFRKFPSVCLISMVEKIFFRIFATNYQVLLLMFILLLRLIFCMI